LEIGNCDSDTAISRAQAYETTKTFSNEALYAERVRMKGMPDVGFCSPEAAGGSKRIRLRASGFVVR
jgi:hypothetical protein